MNLWETARSFLPEKHVDEPYPWWWCVAYVIILVGGMVLVGFVEGVA